MAARAGSRVRRESQPVSLQGPMANAAERKRIRAAEHLSGTRQDRGHHLFPFLRCKDSLAHPTVTQIRGSTSQKRFCGCLLAFGFVFKCSFVIGHRDKPSGDDDGHHHNIGALGPARKPPMQWDMAAMWNCECDWLYTYTVNIRLR